MATRIDHLMSAVFVADDGERREALDRHLAPDFVYVTPEAVFEGADGLSEAFAPYRRPDRRPASVRRTSPVELHHGYFRFSWVRTERGTTAHEGVAFGALDETGAINRVVTFEGLVPLGPNDRS
ncbi:MAG TPA: hypothetical protein VHD39_01430 [Acidimicrobiales bacterium]|nr:hypothetical protein [Acidimicrobiales bacterium]